MSFKFDTRSKPLGHHGRFASSSKQGAKFFLGDFNLDYSKKYDVVYVHQHIFDNLEVMIQEKELIQLIEFFLNVGTPSGVHLFDHLLWPIFQSSIHILHYTLYNFSKFLHN